MARDVKRIRLLGAESTGKSTLARALAEAYEAVWNPEYGRPYTELGRDPDAPWTSEEFTHIARIQCWYEDFLAGSARGVLICDTDAFTTAVGSTSKAESSPVPRPSPGVTSCCVPSQPTASSTSAIAGTFYRRSICVKPRHTRSVCPRTPVRYLPGLNSG